MKCHDKYWLVEEKEWENIVILKNYLCSSNYFIRNIKRSSIKLK